RERTLADLRRRYIRASGRSIEESSFYDRFSAGWVKLLKQAVAHALQSSFGPGRALRGQLERFRDVLISDATVIRLHQMLQHTFPACRTNHTQAAAKLHLVMNVSGNSKQSVKLTAERAHENRVLRIGPWVAGRLMLFDLGYYDFNLFARIHHHGGFFLSRLKSNANPTLTAIHRTHRGHTLAGVGLSLTEALTRLQGELIDGEVELTYRKRRYNGKRRTARLSVRLVGRPHSTTGEYHLYLTNIPPEHLPAEDVQATYALRWQIELLFKELKRHYRLEDMPSRKRDIVESLLYAAILSLAASRRLLQALRQALPAHAPRLKEHRFAALLAVLADDLLTIVIHGGWLAKHLQQRLCNLLFVEAIDPNKSRP
ncbi:MAG: IS4 family transposase, partial [Candidatus Methylomirabilales bacterium]